MTAARFLCIGTHHKTGTVWMRKVWHRVAGEQSIPLMQCNRAAKLAQAAPTGPQIVVNWSSRFPAELWALPHARVLHLVRDPRDVLLSGMRYHRTAPLGNEKFLRRPRAEWAGRNYQEQINALPDDLARLRFEMENKHDLTLREMLDFPRGHPSARDVRYEDLIEDRDCRLMRGILQDFAIEGLDIDGALRAYWDLSLFGGLARPGARAPRLDAHIASGRRSQWRRRLPREIAELYAERYQDALERLGYADDTSWVAECPPAARIAA